MSEPLSRRRLLRVAGIGLIGGSALFAGCGANTRAPVAVGPDESDAADAEILNFALDLEHMIVAGYAAALGRLRGEARTLGAQFLDHEREHVKRLQALITDLGGVPHRSSGDAGIPRLRTQADALRHAVELENTAIAAYTDALPKLSRTDLRATASAVITTEAEHAAVLLGLLGEPQAPSPFVVGKVA